MTPLDVPAKGVEIARLLRLTKASLVRWEKERKRAENEARSGDLRNALNAIIWLKGYRKALEDVFATTRKP